jgi:hypothetical protein
MGRYFSSADVLPPDRCSPGKELSVGELALATTKLVSVGAPSALTALAVWTLKVFV